MGYGKTCLLLLLAVHGPHGFGLYQNNVMPGLLFCMERKYVNNCSSFFFFFNGKNCLCMMFGDAQL
jgi:hypothetical protein